MDPLLTLAFSLVIAVVSSWVTVNLSLRRYHSERWWDRKAEAYSAVIEALHHSKAFSDEHLSAAQRGRDLSEDRDQELRDRARKANAEIAKAADVGAFLLSEEALTRLRKYQVEDAKASNTDSWLDYILADQTATASCLDDIIEIAKRDLRPESPLFRWFR